jgi:hypothetical protein
MSRYRIVLKNEGGALRSLLSLALVVAAGLALSATPLKVNWADGRVEIQSGSAWTAVELGDVIDSASTLRLAPGATVELLGGGRKLSLTATGSYDLDSLLRQGADSGKKKTGLLEMLAKRVDPKPSTSATAVGAVRGAAVEPNKDTMTWASDAVDVSGMMEEGRGLMREGDFAAAALKFGEAAGLAEGDAKDAAAYAEAWALASDDSVAQAVKILREMPSSGPWASARALLLARLDLDSGAKDEAKALLEEATAAYLFAGQDVDLAESLLAEANAD